MDRRKFLKIMGYAIPLSVISPKIILDGLRNLPFSGKVVSNKNPLFTGEIGDWQGVRVIDSSKRVKRWSEEMWKASKQESYLPQITEMLQENNCIVWR